MNRLSKICIASCIFLLFGNVLQAQQLKKLAQTSMKWLSIPVGARPMAMGNAYFSMSGSASDIFWNPAGTGFIASSQVFISHVPWIADINQEAVALAVPLERIGVISASVRYLDFGTQQGTRLASNAQGWEYTEEFSPSSYQIGLGFSQQITDRFSYGIHLSYVKENLGAVFYAPVLGGDFENPREKSTSLGLFKMDFGVLYYTGFHDLRLGMTLRNFSEEQGYGNVGNPIPMDLRFGMAMNVLAFFFEEAPQHKAILACDLSHPRDYSERLHFGLEYIFADFVALRMGYKTNYDEENVSFGAGLLPKFGIGSVKVAFDYALVPFGVFDSVQVFSFSINF
jgi:hypothetical protein